MENLNIFIAVASWVTAVLSMVVAAVAVAVGYKQAQATTLPFLVLRKELGESEDGMGIYVQNKGPGPAIINSYAVFVPEPVQVEGQPRSEATYYSQLKSKFQGNFEYTILETDYALVPEEKMWLFRFPKGHTNPIAATKRDFMDSTRIEIWYRGIMKQDGKVTLAPSPRFGSRWWRVLTQPL